MAKTYLGIDIGYDSLKLALVRGSTVKKTVSVPMPVNLLREGRLTSTESMGELLRSELRQNRLGASLAAVVLSGESTYLRTTTMPRMTAEQLAINLPYEFSDYITDELKNYVFDYAMVTVPERDSESTEPEEDGEERDGMEVMAAAAPTAMLDELREALRKAGLKLARAAPAESAFIALIRAYEGGGTPAALAGWFAEYCILDLGFRAIRMYMFRGDRHIVTRVLDIGLSSLDEVIADAKGVDIHLAHTYLLTNFEDVQHQDYALNAYANIAVELMRALNFYRFSNPESQLDGVWLCGGGAVIEPLREAVAENLDLEIHPARELVPGGESIENCHAFVQAIGLAMS